MQQNTMYLPHKGKIQQNDASFVQGWNALKHNVFTAQGWNTTKRCFNRTRKKCNKTQCIKGTRMKYSKSCINRTGMKCIKSQCIYRTRVKYNKTLLQSHKKEMQQNTMYLTNKGEIRQNVASIEQQRNATKHNVFSAQG